MDACNAIISDPSSLNEQIARNIFDVLPDGGPIAAIMDRAGHCWSSDPQELANLNLSPSLLADLQARVDDGVEPAFTRTQDTSLTMTQLPTENARCGYLLIVIPRCKSELTQTHIDLVESLLNQISLVAVLTEHNHRLKERQAMYLGVREPSGAIAN
jgi:hypothetical protein